MSQLVRPRIVLLKLSHARWLIATDRRKYLINIKWLFWTENIYPKCVHIVLFCSIGESRHDGSNSSSPIDVVSTNLTNSYDYYGMYPARSNYNYGYNNMYHSLQPPVMHSVQPPVIQPKMQSNSANMVGANYIGRPAERFSVPPTMPPNVQPNTDNTPQQTMDYFMQPTELNLQHGLGFQYLP